MTTDIRALAKKYEMLKLAGSEKYPIYWKSVDVEGFRGSKTVTLLKEVRINDKRAIVRLHIGVNTHMVSYDYNIFVIRPEDYDDEDERVIYTVQEDIYDGIESFISKNRDNSNYNDVINNIISAMKVYEGWW